MCQVLNLGNNVYSVQYVNPVTAPEKALCSVTASQSGDSKYNAATDVVKSFNWIKIPTQIVLSTGAGTPNAAGIYLNLKVVHASDQKTGAVANSPLSVVSTTPFAHD